MTPANTRTIPHRKSIRPNQVRVGRCNDPGAVYIGRGSPLGNPFVMKNASDDERDRVCEDYARWFAEKVAGQDRSVMQALSELEVLSRRPEGVVLGCFCAPKRCHGDTIRDYLLSSTAGTSDISATPEFDRLPAWQPGQEYHVYAGIGSRALPEDMAVRVRQVAQWLARNGYTLRTGDATGSDAAFRAGAKSVDGPMEVYTAADATDRTRAIAREIHPAPQRLKRFALDLMARNTFQVWGGELNQPVDFILAWTPDGHETRRPQGGTGQAVEMGFRKGIPVVNMGRPGWENRLRKVLRMPAKENAA